MTGAVGRPGRVPREAVSILVAVGQVAVQRGSTYAEGLADGGGGNFMRSLKRPSCTATSRTGCCWIATSLLAGAARTADVSLVVLGVLFAVDFVDKVRVQIVLREPVAASHLIERQRHQ